MRSKADAIPAATAVFTTAQNPGRSGKSNQPGLWLGPDY